MQYYYIKDRVQLKEASYMLNHCWPHLFPHINGHLQTSTEWHRKGPKPVPFVMDERQVLPIKCSGISVVRDNRGSLRQKHRNISEPFLIFGVRLFKDGRARGVQISIKTKSTGSSRYRSRRVSRTSPSSNLIHFVNPARSQFAFAFAVFSGSCSVAITTPLFPSSELSRTAAASQIVETPKDVPTSTTVLAPVARIMR